MSPPGRTRLLVLFGGRSAEHEVSCLSARNVLEAIDPERYAVTTVGITREGRWSLVEDAPRPALEAPEGALPSVSDDGDTVALVRTRSGPQLLRIDAAGDIVELAPVDVCFPVLHGPYGEDGTVQGLLASHGLPYVGADVASSAVGIDKTKMKSVFAGRGLPQVAYQSVRRRSWEDDPDGLLDEIEQRLPYPVFTKPARQGSSVGIRKCRTRHEVHAGIEEAFTHDRVALVEAGITDVRELECGVLGNADIEVTPPGEVLATGDFYDFEGKYLDPGLRLQCPAEVSETVLATCRQYARDAFVALGCRGMARVDLFYVPATGEVLVNEINTIPGFTPVSMFPYVWSVQGLDYPRLIDRLVELALEAACAEARYAP